MRKLLAIGGDGGSVFGVVVQVSATPPPGVAGAAMGSELVLLIPLVLAPPLLEPDEERAAAAVPPAAPLERPDVAPPVLEVVPMWSGGEVSARPATIVVSKLIFYSCL